MVIAGIAAGMRVGTTLWDRKNIGCKWADSGLAAFVEEKAQSCPTANGPFADGLIAD
jgi:hypothetical protein